MSVKYYIEDFYRLTIRVGDVHDDLENVARYLNVLNLIILDKINIFSSRLVDES